MNRILVPIDGSASSANALATSLVWAKGMAGVQLHVLTVQQPIASGNVKRFISADTLNQYYEEEALKVLEPVREQLAGSGIDVQFQWRVGSIADTIVDYAKEADCEHIVMGTRGMGGFSNLLLGSIATKVLSLTHVPVTLVK
ncbi:universal stress protein [Pusillimonas sp. CC-YST705]|uniref:Universal stress protein n=1 Tax=Mesopusillimonas faecipullorum TaxID=2755040 RepID=A0ABS8CB41_9BURK|nr:universal stress protein [Mesopusillimonas faecipullorum]MCB5363077.1 universal stress protein [Mesopusillimonas faecipullorum]